ncbi:secreted RxLR effector protein 78-like [Carya illinoinensis]|uniref:secreted RxLR effector protein 78-like n=1 Tax=Carya illinoinensis TaxID=32201 RepID=UPI001C7268B8|nr:secreted RxLR effector protein 78-like [Carya illinoinensis]
MKAILPSIISDIQTAFLPRRLITDNVLVAYELVHYLKQKREGKKDFMSLKLDMSKAYNRVEWDFLECILLKLGFNSGLMGLIMKCVTSVSFSILVNGNPTEPISPTQGLRQGDPLSPYLFLICTEALVSLLKNAELDRSVKGVRICTGLQF